MSTDMKPDYDALAARLTDPNQPVTAAGEALRGAEAAEVGRDFLLREYGSTEAIERAMVKRGRPRIGASGGPSPTVRARITPDEYAAMKRLSESSGRSQSDLVREAVHQLLRDHKLVS